MSIMVEQSAGQVRRAVAPETAPEMVLLSEQPVAVRHLQVIDDLLATVRLRRLCWTLGWLDIKGRYRGSLLGPLWLTLSTAVMVAALGILYSTLFRIDLRSYLPFLALSLILWNFVQTLVTEGCTCFTQAEGMIRSVRMPYSLYAARIIIRNVLVLAHNVIVIAVVYLLFGIWPGLAGLIALPALLLWLVDSLAVCMLLGALCARFRDVPPIVGSLMQIAFFVSPIIWKPELIEHGARFLPLNPFYSLFEIVRAPLLGEIPGWGVWACAILYSAALGAAAWSLFLRVRSRLAFWL
jgi:lipopolysaccharide transport system permease protein